MKKVLITGIAGGQGRLLTRRLNERFEICGVDRVRWEGSPRGVRCYVVDLRKKKFADVLRRERPACVVHMGFIQDFRTDERERHDVNVTGTKQLLDHCIRNGVESLVVLSTGYVYGALPENPYFMDEDFPLSASRSYPEIRDHVEVDTLVTTFLWRYPQIRTCVLRPVNVLGYYTHSMIGQYLRQRWVPTVMGFDPMKDLKFIRLAHEHGLGVGNPSEIEIVGDDIRNVNFGFRGSLNENTFASWGQKLIYWGPLKPLENLLLRSPIVPWSFFASRAYHDGWYSFKGTNLSLGLEQFVRGWAYGSNAVQNQPLVMWWWGPYVNYDVTPSFAVKLQVDGDFYSSVGTNEVKNELTHLRMGLGWCPTPNILLAPHLYVPVTSFSWSAAAFNLEAWAKLF